MSVDKCRRVYTNQKNFLWFLKKWDMVPFCCYCNYATVGHTGMQICNFVVLSVITALHNIPSPTLAKPICLLFHLTYVKSSWIDVYKTSQGKWEAPCAGEEARFPPQKNRASSLHKGMCLPNAVLFK